MTLSPSLAAQSYVLVDLTAEMGEDTGYAYDVNDDHIVVGVLAGQPVRWERTAGQWSMELLPSDLYWTIPYAVNNAGIAVGWGWQINTPGWPIIWEDDDYEIVFEMEYSCFSDINSSGQIVGGGRCIHLGKWRGDLPGRQLSHRNK